MWVKKRLVIYYIVHHDRVGVRREQHKHDVLVPLSRFELMTCSNAQFRIYKFGYRANIYDTPSM